jgi:hypothetical protein
MERACDAIDAIVRAESYLDANVNVPLLLQQLAIALERTGGDFGELSRAAPVPR